MKYQHKIKLERIINELSSFLERDFSAKFKYLSEKEDRQLFFLAKLLTQLKQISSDTHRNNDIKEENIIPFPQLINKN